MISRLFCEQHDLEIQPLSKLVDCDAVNGTQIEYEGYVELNFQVPGRNFSEDHLFLVVPPIEYHKEVPAIVGTYVIDRYVQYLKNIGADIVPTLDHSWQSTYYARIEAIKLREAHENEAPLGFAKVTKATVIPAGQRKEIHALTKIRHGGYGVNLIGEVSEKHPLPQGLQLKNSYCDLTPGSAKVNLMIENTTNKNVVIPARAIESPPKVRRSTRSTKGIPPTRYGSVISHKVNVNNKIGKLLNSISKKIDVIQGHIFD